MTPCDTRRCTVSNNTVAAFLPSFSFVFLLSSFLFIVRKYTFVFKDRPPSFRMRLVLSSLLFFAMVFDRPVFLLALIPLRDVLFSKRLEIMCNGFSTQEIDDPSLAADT